MEKGVFMRARLHAAIVLTVADASTSPAVQTRSADDRHRRFELAEPSRS
jgi:hypothetical protein